MVDGAALFAAKGSANAPRLAVMPINATIHKIDERVAIADLEALSQIYRGVLERLLVA